MGSNKMIAKQLGNVAGIGIVLVVVFGAVAAVSWSWRYFTAEVRGVVGAEERIQSAPSRIAAYDRFFDLCAAIQGHEGTIGAQQELLQSASATDAERITANIAALKGRRAQDIARYNADAAKDYTVGQFRSASLPYRLDPAAPATDCTAP